MPIRISLACLLLAAATTAAQPAPRITLELLEVHPAAGTEVGPFTPVYGRIGYRTDTPVRLTLRPYRDGQPVLQSAYYSGSPHYPAPAGEAAAWFSFSEPQTVDEIRAIATDDFGTELARTSVDYPLRWRAGAGAPEPAAWIASLQQHAEALSRQQQPPSEDLSLLETLLMQLVFVLVPVSVVLQIIGVVVLEGRPRALAWLSAFAMAGLWLFVVVTSLAGSNLSPIWLVFLSPLFVVFLAGLLTRRWLTRRRTGAD